MNCDNDKVHRQALLDLINRLYQEEDEKISDLEAHTGNDEETRKLKKETTRGLMDAGLRYKVRYNTHFSCPFCPPRFGGMHIHKSSSTCLLKRNQKKMRSRKKG